jgi:peptidoglycan/xylan/chitin deacetylase (PgdA/CDA1 family)
MAAEGLSSKLRDVARSSVIAGLSMARNPAAQQSWLRFPYYHHVFDDERAGFARQIRYFKNIADVISIDDAVALLESDAPIDGRYICITFDDGFKNWIENAVPILVEEKAVAAFFVAARYIDTDLKDDQEKLLAFYDDGRRLMEFLSWEDCRTMIGAGMTIGSHSVDHVHLMDLSDPEAEDELRRSKELIENNTGAPCDHFCCPFGRAGIDYDPACHPKMTRQVGYKSFLTGHRGDNPTGTSPFDIKRDHFLANWGNYQLRYFLGAS